jgi:hypothetical protein
LNVGSKLESGGHWRLQSVGASIFRVTGAQLYAVAFRLVGMAVGQSYKPLLLIRFVDVRPIIATTSMPATTLHTRQPSISFATIRFISHLLSVIRNV